jgi:hypothetical protein
MVIVTPSTQGSRFVWCTFMGANGAGIGDHTKSLAAVSVISTTNGCTPHVMQLREEL